MSQRRLSAPTRLRWTVPRLLTFSSVLAVSVVLLVGANAYLRIGTMLGERQQVEHAFEAVERIDAVSRTLKDAQRGQRGYLITGTEYYLEPYSAAVARVYDELGAMQVADDLDGTGSRYLTLRFEIGALLRDMGATIELRRTDGFAAAQAAVEPTAAATRCGRSTAS